MLLDSQDTFVKEMTNRQWDAQTQNKLWKCIEDKPIFSSTLLTIMILIFEESLSIDSESWVISDALKAALT